MKRVVLLILVQFVMIALARSAVAESPANEYRIDVELSGSVSMNGTPLDNVLEVSNSSESLLVSVIDNLDEPLATVLVSYHHPFDTLVDFAPRPILSRCTCQAILTSQTDTRYDYTIEGMIRGASLSIRAEYPRGTLDVPLVFAAVRGIDRASPWFLGVALLFLLAASGLLGWMIWEYFMIRKFSFRADPVDRPPNDLSPSLLSLLPAGKMTDRTLAAMLLDLARRDFLAIGFVKGEITLRLTKELDLSGPGFAFGSIPGDSIPQEERDIAAAEGLTLGEKYLLAKLFVDDHPVVTQAELHARFRRHLSSWKIGKVFAETYRLATQQGFFIRNPHLIHLRYRGVGVSVFFFGVMAFIGSVFFFEDQPLILGSFAILALVGFLITRMVRYLPLLTVTGQAEWIRWEAFEKYLADDAPIRPRAEDEFFAYLVYAMAFGRSETWARRFRETPVSAPAWLVIEPSVRPADEIGHELEHHLHTIAALLSRIHEHTVR